MSHHLRRLERVEQTCQLARRGGVVEIYHTHGHILRLPFVHERREEHRDEHGEEQHRKQVHAVGCHTSAFALGDKQKSFHSLLFKN